MALIFTVIVVALVFEYINGFHDTANSIATVVSTKVLRPREAVLLAAIFNLIGALLGTAVARTISSGLVNSDFVSMGTLVCALLGAIIWNLLTWWVGLPSSSSHALVGGLIGSTIAAAHTRWSVVIWSVPSPTHWWEGKGVLWKVVVPMVTSPLAGFIFGFILMALLYVLLRNWRPRRVNVLFGKLQLFSSAGMSLMHGTNDAQKTMGIIALALFTATKGGVFDQLPPWAGFLRLSAFKEIPTWIKVMCAVTMAAGTAAGGWRIIRTLGQKMVKLQPIHGFASETTAAVIIYAATHYGIPVSTTHCISSAIMGVGATKRLGAVKWLVVIRMVLAWLLTIPVTALLAYLLVQGLRLFHLLN